MQLLMHCPGVSMRMKLMLFQNVFQLGSPNFRKDMLITLKINSCLLS